MASPTPPPCSSKALSRNIGLWRTVLASPVSAESSGLPLRFQAALAVLFCRGQAFCFLPLSFVRSGHLKKELQGPIELLPLPSAVRGSCSVSCGLVGVCRCALCLGSFWHVVFAAVLAGQGLALNSQGFASCTVSPLVF